MLHLCIFIPETPSLNIDWGSAMNMPVGLRNALVERISELREETRKQVERANRSVSARR